MKRLIIAAYPSQLCTGRMKEKDRGTKLYSYRERPVLYGMGYIPSDASIHSPDDIKTYHSNVPENDYIRSLIHTARR
jgi:hypothetical protein